MSEDKHLTAQKFVDNVTLSAAHRLLTVIGVPLLILGIGWLVATSVDVKASLAKIDERFYWMQKNSEVRDMRITKLEDRVEALGNK